MIVLSSGMPKAGTGWCFNITNDLLIAAGHQDVRAIRSKFRLHRMLKYYNCNVEEFSPVNLAWITILHLLGNTFVIKTHNSPTKKLRLLMSTGIMRATYIYRDPRDVTVSAFEHGQKIRDRGATHTFAALDTIKTAILCVSNNYLPIWDAWVALGQAMPDQILLMRYEDLLNDTVAELRRLVDFLDLDVPVESCSKIIATYQKDLVRADEQVLHFNQGIVGRFKSVMNSEELALCQLYFGAYLNKMGYQE